MHNQKNLRERYMSGTYNGGSLENSQKFIDAVSQKGISLEELNFKKNVIGSDETGNGEAFRALIVVAAYVKKENVEKLIEYNIRDSKWRQNKANSKDKNSYEQMKKKICDKGKKLTGFTSYTDFEKQRENGIVIEKDYVTFVANVIPNGVYNEKWKSEKTKKGYLNQRELIREEHAAAVKLLAKEVKYDYVVVDNFECSHPENIQGKIGLPEDKMIIVEKADAFSIAVACASVIAKYLSYLYIEELAAGYGLDEFDDLGKTGKITPEMCEQLWKKLENPRLFFKNYVKKFNNVVDCLNAKEEGLGKLYDEA